MPNRLAFETLEDRARELARWTPNVPFAVWLGAFLGVFVGTSTFLLGLLSSLPEMKVRWRFISLASFAGVVVATPVAVGAFWPAAGATVALIQVVSFVGGAILGRLPRFGEPASPMAMILARI